MLVSSNVYFPQQRSLVARRLYQTIALAAAFFLIAYVATQLIEILFTIFAGILLVVFFAGVSQELNEDVYVSRPLALLLTIVGLAGLLVGLWKLAGPDISE